MTETEIGVDVGSISLTVDKVQELLDSPSNSQISDATIILVVKRSHQWISSQTDIDDYDDQSVVDAIYAFAVWQLYMIYVESISEYLKHQTPRMIMSRLEEFQSIAILYLKAIGVIWPLDEKGRLKGMNIDEIKTNYGYSNAMGVLTLSDVYDN